MRESQIEAYLVKRVKDAGGIAFKFTSPGRRSVPDRLVILPPTGCAADDNPDAPRYAFIELKAPGNKPTEAQQREHERLRALGCDVRVIDSKGGVDQWLGAA